MSGTSQLRAEIEKPEGSRSNKVTRQSDWQTAGSGSRFSHSHHGEARPKATSCLSFFVSSDGKLLQKFSVVYGLVD